MPQLLGSDRCRLTIVDDDDAALDVLCRAAAMWDFECQSAHTAEAALEMLKRQPTPIVVTDLRMPGRGGDWLVREIQKRWPEISVIVVTAGDEDDAMFRCLQAGAHHYFLKPINLDEFHHALQATLTAYHLRWQSEQGQHRLEVKLARKTRRLKQTFFSAVNSLVRTLEARDPYTSGHSIRVARLSVRLAEALRLPGRFVKQVSLSAKLHDIGKVGMAEGILNKPDILTPSEFDLVRDHPAIGERILKPIIRSRTILHGIRHHHERFDGGGYPDGLRGVEIPLVARIIALADCFDALTSSRAYRTMLKPEVALEVLLDGSGTQFDPALAPIFARMMNPPHGT